MPILPNARHELFAQNLARGMSKADAYAAAGYRPCQQNAWRLARVPEVADRVAELQSRMAERTVITASQLIDLAEGARLLAMKTKQSSAAIAAIREMGVLAGVRREQRLQAAARTLNEMSDEELAEIARRGGDRE